MVSRGGLGMWWLWVVGYLLLMVACVAAQRKKEAAEQVEHLMRVIEALYGGK